MTRTGSKQVMSFGMRVIRGDATSKEAQDTGMALVLVFLLAWLLGSHRTGYIFTAFALHLLNMIWPRVFRPVAVLWLGLSHMLGTLMSKVILSVIFFAVVTPIGVWRRMIGADSLKLKAFKAGRGTVMRERNHTFVGKDLEQPY